MFPKASAMFRCVHLFSALLRTPPVSKSIALFVSPLIPILYCTDFLVLPSGLIVSALRWRLQKTNLLSQLTKKNMGSLAIMTSQIVNFPMWKSFIILIVSLGDCCNGELKPEVRHSLGQNVTIPRPNCYDRQASHQRRYPSVPIPSSTRSSSCGFLGTLISCRKSDPWLFHQGFVLRLAPF